MSLSSPHPVLLVEDTPSLARMYIEYMKREPYDVTHVETGGDALKSINDHMPRIVLLDLKLPDMDGMDILKEIKAMDAPCSVVVITAHGSVKVAVEAMRGGAFDFLVKPFNADRLLVTMRNALDRQRLVEIVETYEQDFARRRYHGFIGSSLAMQAVYRIIDSAAASKATVFITGESGTGKEVCAEAIHRQSPRAAGPFIAINCGAIPHDLMESELFGHVKGAFTGAISDRDGAAGRAHGGTLFLDEICELDLDLQTKLLRFIQTGTITKVGGSRLEKVDIRILCSTNKNPWNEVEAGRFREDLYYRLHVIPIVLPPLREREDDVIDIARTFLTEYAREEGKSFDSFAPEVEAALHNHLLPGNIRQLQNIIRNVVVLHEGSVVTGDMLPEMMLEQGGRGTGKPGLVGSIDRKRICESAIDAMTETGDIKPLWMVEKETIEQAINFAEGNIPRAATMLDISPSTIYRKRLSWKAEGRETEIE
ncbi:MAG: sigma-54 dependent transcriptional regulator [Pseudomonadota bacterium]|nr:sigma-54 dependent transcriptional regulator [Pseudomonadota bacterium]